MYIKSTSIIAIEGVICCQCSDSIEYCKSEDKGEYFFFMSVLENIDFQFELDRENWNTFLYT